MLANIATGATVLRVLAGVRLAPIAMDVLVAVGPPGLAHWLRALAVQTLRLGVRHLLANLPAAPTVLHVLAAVRLAPIAMDVVVAVTSPGLASVFALAAHARSHGVRQISLTLVATGTTVVNILRHMCLAPGFTLIAVLKPRWTLVIRSLGASCTVHKT